MEKLTKMFYRPVEVAELLSLGRTKIFSLLKSGELISVKVGHSRLIHVASLEAYADKILGKRNETLDDSNPNKMP